MEQNYVMQCHPMYSWYSAPAAIDRYLLPVPELSSKPAARRCCCSSTERTDGETDRWTPDRYIGPAARNNAGSVYYTTMVK